MEYSNIWFDLNLTSVDPWHTPSFLCCKWDEEGFLYFHLHEFCLWHFSKSTSTRRTDAASVEPKGWTKYFSPPQKAGFLFLQMWSGHLHCAPSRNLDIHNMFFSLPDDICICWFVLSWVFRLVNTKPVGWFVQLCVLEGALNLIKHCVNIRRTLQKGFMVF